MNKNNDKFKMNNDFYTNKVDNFDGLKVWLDDNIQEVVDTNLATGKIHELKWLLIDEKDPQRMIILSQEASTFINRAINGRTSITQTEKDVIKKCFVDNYMIKNDVRQIDHLILSQTDKDVSKCIIIVENDLIKPLITEYNINTDMGNMIFNEINLGNLDMGLICVFGIGIIGVLYLLNKLLNTDEIFSIASKSSHTLFNNSTTKGGLVNKGGYDCDDCCCGGSCSCCCGHQKVEIKEGGSKRSDVPLAWGLYFQDGASPSFEGIVDLHNRIMFYLVVILFGVTWVMISIMRNFNKSENKLVYRYLNHGTLIELIWTVGPALVLVAIAFPSFKLLYLMDEVIDPAMTVKVTGHQWYWEYEYADFLNEENETINFDSYMKDEASLEKGELRMLEVDNPVVLPVDTHIRFIITGADVLHDWAMPSLGLKVDACPGRLNQASVIIERTGHFYGQCSEICGVLHSSMPIKIEAVEVEKFFSWLLEQ
jgi:cytochrome c oxidase subunit 2